MRVSLHGKFTLAVVGSSFLAASLSIAIIASKELDAAKQAASEEGIAMLSGLTEEFVKVISFNTTEVAVDLTTNLERFPNIEYIVLRGAEGSEVFWFSKSDKYSQPPADETESTRFEIDVLHIQHPIVYLGKEYGRVYMGKSTQSYIERIESYIRLIAWLIPGLLLFSFIFAYWLKRFFTTPIAELATTVNKIALENAFDRRVHTDRDDEIGQLYTDFNKLLQTVTTTQKNLADQKYALDQSAIVSITDSTGVIIYVNDNYCKLYAYSREELIGNTHRMVHSNSHPDEFFADMWNTLNRGNVWTGEIKNHTKDGSHLWVNSTIVPFLDKDDKPYQFLEISFNITDRKRAESTLIEAQKEAEHANRTKSEFLSSMSHELRTPMNSILGFAQLLSMDQQFPLTADQKNSVEHISSSGMHLLTLLNEVLDLAKIESGKLEISIEDTDVGQIVNEVTKILNHQAHERRVTLHNQIENNNSVYIRADYTRLKQVLLNILSNAIKYNREGGEVILFAALQENKKLRISISDTGSGISEEKLAYIFEPFNRLGQENGPIEGTGIGLTISKRMVELMGGTIGASSILNKSTTFWVEFEASKERYTRTEQMEYNSNELINNKDNTQQNEPNKVLYIEDNPANMDLMRQILSKFSQYELLEAETAEKGLNIAEAEKPAIILLDINLPGMSGFDALKILQNKGLTDETTVIALSANATKKDIIKGKKAGFSDYLTKPIDILTLMDVLNRGIPAS